MRLRHQIKRTKRKRVKARRRVGVIAPRPASRRWSCFPDGRTRSGWRPGRQPAATRQVGFPAVAPVRTIGPAKVQQRSSGGCWRTLTGLAEFAIVQSGLSTVAKWGISKLDALRDLLNGHDWLPPSLEPP